MRVRLGQGKAADPRSAPLTADGIIRPADAPTKTRLWKAIGSASRRSSSARPRRPGTLRRPGGRGALFVLASFFVASSVLRAGETMVAGGHAGSVSALLSSGWATAQESMVGESDTGQNAVTQSPDYLLAALAEREASLSERESAVAERLRTLEMAEAEFAQNMNALLAAEEALRATLSLADGAAQADLDRLTRVYESMKPKDASAQFAAMDPNFAAGFLGQMNPASAAAIMAGLPPEVANTVSLVLASRNMEVPRN